jgi:lipopolysaccharide biosynthesis regulator YciM
MQLDPEEVEAGLALPNLFRRQGFVFHKIDAE